MNHIRLSTIFFAVSLGVGSVSAAEVDTALIESVILINFDALSGDYPTLSDTRIRRDGGAPHSAAEVNASINDPSGLESAFVNLLKDHSDEEIADAVGLAFNYTLNPGIPTFGLDFENAMASLALFTEVAFEANAGRDPAGSDPPDPKNLAKELVSQLLEDGVYWAIDNNQPVPEVGREVVEAIGRGAMAISFDDEDARTELAEELADIFITEALNVLEAPPEPGQTPIGLTGGIVPVKEKEENLTMMYEQYVFKDENDRAVEEKFRFRPDKARFIEYIANGVGVGIMESSISASADIASLAKAIGSKAAEAAVIQLASLTDGVTADSDHSLFLYETIRAIGYGTSMSSVLATSDPSKAQRIAEEVSYGVASAAVKHMLDQNELGAQGIKLADIARVGEAAAHGTSMGAGLAGSMEEGFDRAELAKFAALGAAKGAMEEAADKKSNTEEENDELLALARGTAMGSVLGSTAMAVYNHLNQFEVDVQKVISAAAEGAAYGSMTADLRNIEIGADGNPVLDEDGNVEEDNRGKLAGHQEDFEVEIARAVADGASTGALFEITTLLQTKPDVLSADISSLKTAKSVSYGTTLGAILGGDAAGVSSDVSVKQATEQGLTEGSLDGVALAKGKDVVTDITINSETAIKAAIGAGNKTGAADAARSLSLKTINASVEDMRQLMKLYGINPQLTNPGFIFPNPKHSGEESFLFDDEKDVIVTPI